MKKIINLEVHIDTPEAVKAVELILSKVTRMHSRPKKMTLKEVGEYSGLSESTIRRYVKKNFLTSLQSVNRGKVFFDREEVEKVFFDKHFKQAPESVLKRKKRRRKNFI